MSDRVPSIAVVRNAISLACHAPSIHNSQPWHWLSDGRALHLFIDRRRLVRIADRSGREVIISCGVVLDHARTAMEAAGWKAAIERFPDPDNRDHLATLVFRPLKSITDQQLNRATTAILERRTDRLPLREPTYWRRFIPLLEQSIEDSVVNLEEISNAARPRLARASRLTAELRREDSSYTTELRCWTAPFALYEGIPQESLATAPEAARVDVRRDFPTVSNLDRRRGDIDRSRILVLSTLDDSRRSVLLSGEALSRVLLECTTAGMATCTLTHMIELDESRDVVECLIERRGKPQALVRVGMAPPMEALPAATPRLPLDEVLEIR